jgi:signal transduction histidine kinase
MEKVMNQLNPTLPPVISIGGRDRNRLISAENLHEHKPVFGFSAIVFCASTALALLTANECKSIFHIPSLLYGTVLWCWWGLIASSIWALGRRIPSVLRFTPKILCLHLLAGSALSVTHLVLLSCCDFSDPSWHRNQSVSSILTEHLSPNRIGFDLLIYGFLVGVVAVVRLQFLSQREAIRSLELQRELSASQLHALQAQLEPHFLFNTLNSITTLVGLGRQEQAMQTLAHLNDILHATLAQSAPEKVPLSQELDTVNHYLAIEQMRFSDRLQIVTSVDPGALDGLVPCFLLQPLLENAIRHGISNCEDGGIIQTSAVKERDRLVIQVRDNGPGLAATQQSGHGIGLRNTSKRLTHFYAEQGSLRIDSPPSGGFVVSVTIPYERSAQ